MYTPSYQGKDRAPLWWALLCLSALSTTGCASAGQRAEQSNAAAVVVEANPDDPYEGFNRSMYGFNMGLDRYFLKPIATGYRTITPDFMETGVSNFFNNLKGINVALNDFLQGKVEQGASDTGRFVTNSTLGVLGLFDVASDLGMQSNVEDFGQTLAVWGVDQGPYLVLPVLGPTTARDGSAVVVDKAANPGTYIPGSGIVEGINDRANAEGALNFIDEAALDPYVFTRESFLQYRKNLINDGKSDTSSYDLDVDAAIDDVATPASKSSAAPVKEKSVKSKKPSVEKAAKSDAAVVANSSSNNPNQAFDNMSKSFDKAAAEFQEANAKMEKIAKKKQLKRQ